MDPSKMITVSNHQQEMMTTLSHSHLKSLDKGSPTDHQIS
eukprot:CAMPEP_0170563192 /NCGR_PEP_ID=MMETSP0211-20121228/64894_1 /TAXON_ID=311385 /ORGANISM="Pseudokeronopsis sp., Strain OXSARD2" /LENGTH=39 /DNA_ID= /DNA_START= /DNA_END= /DNA_ORIENTATION=